MIVNPDDKELVEEGKQFINNISSKEKQDFHEAIHKGNVEYNPHQNDDVDYKKDEILPTDTLGQDDS